MQKPKFPQITQNLGISALTSHAALILKGLTITFAISALYLQDVIIVFSNALGSDQTFHILAIPVLFIYFLYRKRRMVNATISQKETLPVQRTHHFQTLAGILLTATAVITYWYGSYTFTPLEYHMFTLPFFAAGLILTMFNWQTLRQLLFPVAFLTFLAPPPVEILYNVGSTLSALSAEAANALVNLFGVASSLSTEYGNPILTITRPDKSIMNFTVDIACSGIYSLIGFTIFAIFIAYITRGRLINKLAVLILGVPLIIALNILRITTILAIGYNYGDQLALQFFHAVGATALMFIGTLILLAATEKAFKKPKPTQPCPNCNPTKQNALNEFCPNCGKLHRHPQIKLRETDIAKIASIALILAVLLSIQAPVFALTEGPAEILVQTPQGTQANTQTVPLPQIPDYNVSYIYRDTNFEQLSGEDASLTYAYSSTNGANPTIWVAIEIASTTGPIHRWETCLVNWPLSQGSQPTVTQLELTDIQMQENPPIVGRFFAFQYHDTNQTQAVLYWYETATFNLNGTSQLKNVKMSLVAYPQSPQDVATTKNQLMPIATAINNYWQPIKTWTAIALAISQNGLALSAATTAMLAALVIYRMYLDQQDRASLRRLYAKLPEQNQLLVIAVGNAQKQGAPTTSGIAKELEKLTKERPSEYWLNEKLREAENAGLIKKTIVGKDDTPTIAWKTQAKTKTQS